MGLPDQWQVFFMVSYMAKVSIDGYDFKLEQEGTRMYFRHGVAWGYLEFEGTSVFRYTHTDATPIEILDKLQAYVIKKWSY